MRYKKIISHTVAYINRLEFNALIICTNFSTFCSVVAKHLKDIKTKGKKEDLLAIFPQDLFALLRKRTAKRFPIANFSPTKADLAPVLHRRGLWIQLNRA